MAEVSNPLHAALLELRRRVLADLYGVERALTKAGQDMGGERVWLGPEARTWRDDLGTRRAQARRACDHLLTALDEALAGQPPRVSEATADVYRRQRAGRL